MMDGTFSMRENLPFIFSIEIWRMAVWWTVCLLSSYMQLVATRIFGRGTNSYPRRSRPSNAPNRPICVITGATSGLGAATALALSKEGFCVVLAGRSSQLLSKTVERIRKLNKDSHLKAFHIDLSSFQSILAFKESLEKWIFDSDMHASIQILINNAGILATSHRETPEGYDQMMASNYFGAFSLTKLLLPLLKNSPCGSRIVNVTSFTHRNVFDKQVDMEMVSGRHFLRSKQYPFARMYEYSKFFLLLFSYQLHRHFLSEESSRISVLAADPGAVETNILREIPPCISRMAFNVLKLLFLWQSPEDGIASILDAVLAPPDVSGVYFFGGKGRTISSSQLSRDSHLADKLWSISCRMFSLSEFNVASGTTASG